MTKALVDFNLKLEKGTILSVIGHNGSGKTTLLNCIRGTITPDDSGVILVNDKDIRRGDTRIVSVFQDVDAGIIPSMTAIENLVVALSGKLSFLWSFPCRHFKEKIYDFLKSIDMYKRFSEFEHSVVSDLSGGQRQQLAIIMAMLRKPELLLLDEFVANLDPKVSEDILGWTKQYIRESKITTIMVTHDHALAGTWGDYLLEMREGAIVRLTPVNGQMIAQS